MNSEFLLACQNYIVSYRNYRLGLETDLGFGFGRVFFPLFFGLGCRSSELIPVGTE